MRRSALNYTNVICGLLAIIAVVFLVLAATLLVRAL